MSSINNWTFSPSSEPLLQRCLAAAPPPDPNNKWFQKFGKTDMPVEPDNKVNTDYIKNSPIVQENVAINYEDFLVTIQNESVIPYKFVIDECNKKPELISKIAEKLSTNTIEQLFKLIFSNEDEESKTLTTFITKFLPIYMKVQYSRLCIDLLVKINEQYPNIFKELLKTLINDSETPNQILINYIAVLDGESVTNFIKILSSIEISSEAFTHNVLVLYTAYKNCIKNDFTQKYVQKLLVQHGNTSTSDRNFGRLFLTFLQNEKAMERTVAVNILERCLDVHRSPFKRPCSILLKEINLLLNYKCFLFQLYLALPSLTSLILTHL